MTSPARRWLARCCSRMPLKAWMPFYKNVRRGGGAARAANAQASLSRRIEPALLQAKLLSSSQQGDRFTNAPGARFRPLGCMNPNDEVTSVGRRQLSEEFP